MKPHTAPAPRIVILAAGYSSRLGRPKALARVRGRSLLARTVELLTTWATAPIIVVVPGRAVSYRTGFRRRQVDFVVNSRRAQGLSSSVLCGLKRARHGAAVLLVPVDLVEWSHRDAARLIARWRAGRRNVVARRVGAGAATPLILPRRFIALAGGLRGDQGLRDFVRRLPSDAVTLVHLSSAAADVDSPLDLERARRRVRAPPAR